MQACVFYKLRSFMQNKLINHKDPVTKRTSDSCSDSLRYESLWFKMLWLCGSYDSKGWQLIKTVAALVKIRSVCKLFDAQFVFYNASILSGSFVWYLQHSRLYIMNIHKCLNSTVLCLLLSYHCLCRQ